jgi:threonylcarbamoyladenosine tRNA methylthiotransferase MtaB
MNRNYDRSFLSNLVQELHRSIPRLSLGADVIVGFPGETEERFQRTYRLIESLPFSYLHVFPFSRRRGTPASQFPQVIEEGQIKKRAELMRQLGREKRQAFYRQFLHEELDVVVEDRRERATGSWKGFSRNYIPVLLLHEVRPETQTNWINQEVRVKVTEVAENGLVGQVVER